MTAIRYVRGTLPGLEGEHDIAVLEGDTHIGKWIEESRRLDHDQSTLPAIGKLITPESVVYDVGAFVGDHTAFYASRAKWVVAFEAAEDAAECLRINMNHYQNVEVRNLVLGDNTTVKRGMSEENNKGARRVLAASDSEYGTLRARPAAAMDFWVHEGHFPPPSLIKLDIEGWEVSALRGAECTLRTYHPTLVVEVCRATLERAGTSPEELHALLTSYGYEMEDLFTGKGWFPEDPCGQFDVVCR